MKRFLKRFFLVLLLVVVTTLIAAVITATLFQKQIGRRVIAEVNKQLTTELTVERFDMTVLSSFPNVAVNLRGIVLQDTEGGALLEAERVSFNIGLMSFLSSEYKVHSVVISDGALTIKIDHRGHPNYQVFKESPEAEEESELKVSLQLARLKNMELIYDDEQNRQSVYTQVGQADFSGQFSSRQFTLTSEADLTSGFIEVGGGRYLVGKKVGYTADVKVDLDQGNYQLHDVVVDIEGNRFALTGTVAQGEDRTDFDLLATSKDGNLEGVLQLLPQEYQEQLGDFSSSGRFSFQVTVKGPAGRTTSPDIRAELQLQDGRIKSPRLSSDLRDVSFTASYDNGLQHDNAHSVITIDNLKGYFDRELLELSLRVENFDDPFIDFRLNATVPLSAVYKFLAEGLEDPRIKEGAGEIDIRQLQLTGRYKDMINTGRIGQVTAVGEIDFDDAGLVIDGRRVFIDRGVLALNGNETSIKDLQIDAAGSDINFSGTAFNLLPVLFADSVNSQGAELEFAAELYSRNLDIDQLMSLSPYAVAEEQAAAEPVVDSLKTRQIETRERVTRFLRGAFNARLDQFNYNKIEGSQFTGQLEFNNNELTIRGGTNAMKGIVRLDGRLYFEQMPRLEAELTCEDIDVNEFFRQSDNFGQEVLTSENVSGRLNANMIIDAFWDSQGNFLDDKLRVLAGIGINDGELKNFKLLESFSTFVKIRDLQKIRFVNMQNYLEVRNRTLYLPVMFIQSSALNLSISGEHTFDNTFRYNLQVNAGQVLTERFRSYDPTLQPKAARRKGFFNLYYTIFGNLDNYEVKSAKRLVKADFERSEQRRRNIQQALQSAFGNLELIQENADWWDVDPSSADPDYLDFELEGGKPGKSGE